MIDTKQALGVITLSGSVDETELMEAMQALCESKGWSRELSILWDGTTITELVIGRKGLEEIVEVTGDFQNRIGSGKSAFVVRRQLDESMTKIILHMTKTTTRERRLFRSRADALEWLSQQS